MSEKRFTINLEDECIDDAEERIFIDFLDRVDFYELCGFLNEQEAIIKQLEEEKQYWKSKAMTLLMQVRRLTPRMSDKEVIEFNKELNNE